MSEQEVDREGVAGVIVVALEYHTRPATHAHRCVPAVEEVQPLPGNRTDQHALIARVVDPPPGEQLLPDTRAYDVLVLLRTVRQVQKGWSTTGHDAQDEPERERMRYPVDRRGEGDRKSTRLNSS